VTEKKRKTKNNRTVSLVISYSHQQLKFKCSPVGTKQTKLYTHSLRMANKSQVVDLYGTLCASYNANMQRMTEMS